MQTTVASTPAQGAKRPAETQRPDEDGMNWLYELYEIVGETSQEILVFESDCIDDCVSEVFSPPRIVTMARKCGISGGWSVDRLTERNRGKNGT